MHRTIVRAVFHEARGYEYLTIWVRCDCEGGCLRQHRALSSPACEFNAAQRHEHHSWPDAQAPKARLVARRATN